MGERRTALRSCQLCEAMCGLAIRLDGDRVVAVRGDEADPFSRGFVCAKGVALTQAHHDPDRLRTPVRRTAGGRFEPLAWSEALALAGERLLAVRAAHGADALALYMGNPTVHNHGAVLLRAGLQKAIGTRNCFSASSQDTAPRFATSYWLYGSSLAIPVPDIDRTHHFLCVGANPLVSNGSLMTAPDLRSRLRALRARGGRIVVVDPRRTETAEAADEWVPIRPGTDAALLLAMVQVLARDGRVDAARVERIADGWPRIAAAIEPFTPERAAAWTGVPAEVIRRLAREFADAASGVAYSRVGVCNTRHGTLATWATDLLNLAAGRLGEVGGSMFPSPAIDIAALTPLLGDGWSRWKSRVRGLPETFGDLPAAALAEELETPGAGQVRAFVCYAGNPVLSVPNGRRVARALAALEFMVAIDPYINETTRHAHLILPPSSTLAEEHVDLFFANVAVRDTIRLSPAAVARADGARADWQILLEIAERLGGGPVGIGVLDAAWRAGRRLGLRWHPTFVADALLRLGRHGDRFLPGSRGLSMSKLRAQPHGVDLGALEPGVARRVLHRGGRVRAAPEPVLRELPRLAAAMAAPRPELVLIGRREARSCNSWLHNLPALVSGKPRCVLQVHPQDAARAGVASGASAMLDSRIHRGPVLVEVTERITPGVVCLPHGFGHSEAAPWQNVAGAQPGVSANDWTDDSDVEGLVGQSVLNGVTVRLSALGGPALTPAAPSSFSAPPA
ncbi:MAG: molybdopterin-dependent oxidoreductase [Rubrivivax sp.]|nr:molybdopterin-dependent oxidoreductase [Rubrivivax sp.]